MQTARWLFSAGLLGVVLALLSISAAPDVVVDPDPEPVEPKVKKCCEPATKQPPSSGCPPGPCDPSPACPSGYFEGSWDEGGCKITSNPTNGCDEDPYGDPLKPLYACLPRQKCTLDEGDPNATPPIPPTYGWQCKFILLKGASPNKQSNVKDCSGTKCTP